MKNLFVVYGSETKLLKGLYDFNDSYFLRIYNKNIPKKLKNATDVKGIESFKKAFEERIKYSSPKKIIFIGAAFLVQNNFFINERYNEIETMIQTNIINYIKISKFLVGFMKKIKSGQFIYLSSFRSDIPAKGLSIYASSKAFGESFFKILGMENGIFGIYSTSIRLGCMDGKMINVLPKDKIKQYTLSTGNRRLGNSEDVLNTIKYILKNQYCNGGVIDLTSGISF